MKFDLHLHTKYSLDGREEPEKIAKFLRNNGFKGMAITDHDTIKGALNLKLKDFIIITGEEIKTKGGHILAIGIEEEIKSRIADEAVDEIHDKGGIAIIAHPFRFMKPNVNKIDAVEVINARCFPMQNRMAREYAERHNLPTTAGSDAHYLWAAGKAYTIIDENVSNTDDIIEAILKKRVRVGSNYNFIHPLKCSFYSFLSFARRGFKRID